MRGLLILILLIGAVVGYFLMRGDSSEPLPAPVADASTQVQTAQGELVGFIDPHFGARSYLGIPFAAAADGANRWRAPQPVQPWSGVREAIASGPICPQFESLLSGHGDNADTTRPTGQEDCLYLNVWAPADRAASDLPVMLWIHGGGNTIGTGSGYIGANLAQTENLVVITINYRLGVFGWFSHPALHTGDVLDDSGNYGTLDVVAALEWVQENARAFGGNPDNVTLFGESAGAYDTLAMMASPLAKGLFHRAIVQSGGFRAMPIAEARAFQSDGGHPLSSSEIAARLLVDSGRAADLDAARTMHDDLPATELASLLRSAEIDDLFKHFNGGGFGMVDLPDNFADGAVLPAMTNEEIFGNLANHNAVPVILGTNRDENALFMARDPRWTEQFLWVFPRLKDVEHYKRAVNYGSLAWKVRGVDSLADLMTAAGNDNVYAYRWDWDEEPSIAGFDLSVALGAAHGLEIAFVFGDFARSIGEYLYPESPERDQLAREMMGYWAEFARTGNPGTGGSVGAAEWTAWGVGGNTQMVLDTPPNGPRMDSFTVTMDTLFAQLSQDPSITDQRERCTYYADNWRFDSFRQRQYDTLGTEGCNEYSLDSLRSF
ncbi:MAG: carboxylesterase family protein [Pseudomonadota bacterium]